MQYRERARHVRDGGVGRKSGPQERLRPSLVRGRRDHEEDLFRESRDRRVHLDAAAVVAEERVDDPAELDVDIGHAEPLQPGQRPRALHDELRIGREVEQRHAPTSGGHLLTDRPEPRRPVEVVAPSGLLRRSGLEPRRPLPARRLAERRTGGAELTFERQTSDASSRRGLERRPVHRVEAPEGLRRLLVEPSAIVGPPPRPRDVDLGEIHRGVAFDDPLGERLPCARAVDDSLRVEPGRDPEARGLGELAEMEVRVGGEALRTSEVVLEADVAEDRQPFAGVGEDRREVLPILAELHEPAGVDVAGRLRLPLRLEGADHQPPAVVPDVEVPV